ncbi:irregular chiasm C-roughest protein isoform X1, partial [Vespula maculifrons]
MACLKQTSALTLERLRFESKAPRGTYLLIDGRRLDPGNQFVPVKEGSELTLECAAEGGNPPPVLAWGMILSQATLDGPEQPPDNLTVLPSTSARHSGAHLKVLRGHHNATIVCVARHVTLTVPMNASILLDVQSKRKAKVRVCDVILCSPPPTLVSTPPTGWLDFLKESKLQAVFAEKSKERRINSTTRTKTVGIVQDMRVRALQLVYNVKDSSTASCETFHTFDLARPTFSIAS